MLRMTPGLARALGHQPMLSYTQWEGVLALHHGKPCFVCSPGVNAPREPGFLADDDARARQAAHLARIAAEGQHYETFDDAKDLALKVWPALIRAGLVGDAASYKPINLPRSIGALFKGRDEFLELLRDSLTRRGGGCATAITAAPQVLHGLGGVGKTRVAVEYAWQHEAAYEALLFVEADSPEKLWASLAQLAGPLVLNLPAQQAAEQGRQVEAVQRWLREHRRWLLLVDNVDRESTAREVEKLVAALHGDVLITSRLSNWGASVTQLELDVLDEDDAVAFLMERTASAGDAERATAGLLARELGLLALALEQAAAYVRNRRITLAAYVEHFRAQQRREELLAWASTREMQYPSSVAVTWQTSVDQLAPEARTLLELFAWFAPDPIPRSLLVTPGHGVSEPEAALAELAAYSLVALDGHRVRIHRLVQEVTRNQLTHAGTAHSRLRAALSWMERAFAGDPEDVRNWPAQEPLRMHVAALSAYGDEFGLLQQDDPTSWLKYQLGMFFFARALHSEAEPLLRRALAINENTLGPDHPNVALCLNDLAQTLKAMKKRSDAEPLMRRALAIDEKAFGPEHSRVAMRLSNLAQLLTDTTRHSDAEPLMRRALAIAENSTGSERSRVAIILNNLALLLQATNRHDDAEPLMRRALAIDLESLGSEHPNVAWRMNNLGVLLQEQGVFLKDTKRFSEAESLMRRALAIDEKALGREHQNIARDLKNLGKLLEAANRFSEAEPVMRRAVETLVAFTRRAGYAHPELDVVLANYAGLLRASGHTEEAIRHALKAVAPDDAR